MTIYSLYIFDRHCTCVYYQDWHRTKRPKPAVAGNILPAVARSVSPQPLVADGSNQTAYSGGTNTLASSTGVVVATSEHSSQQGHSSPLLAPAAQPPPPSSTALPFDEEAKLVYGVILSLRNMIRKLSGREEHFVGYRTSTYKLHLFETPTGYKFVIFSDPNAESLRFALRQIYIGPFLEYVVRNPLISMDSKERGIDNEYFRTSIDRFVRGLSSFQ